jgi:hypothetical protein
MDKRLYLYFQVLYCLFSNAQNTLNYMWPIDSPFVITGNYGELRPNHFHAGIDFSTKGEINLPVYAVEEGYVSRIRTSPVGYGKSVYITHPDGKVSVYGHLNSFSLKIANLVLREQYNLQSYEVELLPRPRTIYVRRNEIIGLSGNTGGSSGPHLHFELRDEKTEIPLNPLKIYKFNDPSLPDIEHVAFYNLADTNAPKFMQMVKVKEGYKDSLYVERDHITIDQAIIGFAFSGLDRNIPNGNPNNIYSAQLYLDDRLIYSHWLDSISFEENRYVNEFSEAVGKTKFQKCFIPTVYPSLMYDYHYNKGRIILSDSTFHKLVLKVTDECGNKRVIKLYVKAKKFNYYAPSSIKSDIFVNCTKDFRLSKDGFHLFVPARTLYYSTPILVEGTLEPPGRFTVLPSDVNLASAVSVGFKVSQKYLRNREKLILRGKTTISVPTNVKDSVYFSIKNFGSYQLVTDTIPPKAKTLLSERKLRSASNLNSFSLIITDNLSGIGKYDLWLNGTWVLAEYDAKNDLLTYSFDEETPRDYLQFELKLEDRVGNKSVFNYTLRR